MKTEIFHTVNAGLYLWGANTGILVDGLHRGKAEGFSTTPPQILRQMEVGKGIFSHSHLQGMLFTHLHPDHFNGAELSVAAHNIPGAAVYLPGLVKTCPAALEHITFPVGNATVTAVPTTHDGALFEADPHCSFLIQLGEECVFIAGDGQPDEELARVVMTLCKAPITAVFMNVYQLASLKGRAFLRGVQPERIFLYHLPFPEDDTYSISALSEQLLRRFPKDLPLVEWPEHMAWIDDAAPGWWEKEEA